MNHRRLGRVFLVLLVLFGYYEVVKNTGKGIPCLFQYFFHLKCPGCGITHFLIAVTAGDFTGAFLAHPVIFVFSPFLLWLIFRSLWRYVKETQLVWQKWERTGMSVFLVILLVFSVFRNVPGLIS
ncbi:MAG: DUF2752 domain-containing protein [Clostridiales bacterium]|nr:DUF2752 domain-containing protein [Clostridiales bacterium]